MKTPRLPLVAALALLLGGCMVGPDYRRPPVPVAATYKELPGWTQAEPAASAPKGDWWTAFNDPLIDQLEPLVSVSNQTVRQDYANYQQALAEVREARSQLFPTIGVTGSATRARSATGSASTNLPPINSGTLEGTASWTLDLWGQVRRTIEQNAATAQVDEATLANATLSEQISLASDIIQLRISDANIDLLQKTVEAYQQYLRVVADQDHAGTVPPSNLITAREQLESAQASLISLGVARAQYAHAIAVLVGKNPEDLDIPHSTALPTLPTIPVGVPSTLLERRPDIAAAERAMAAQNAAIGVAVAAYYPTISLSALDGFSQAPLSGLLHAANRVWSLGANATGTLFDGGERHAEVDAAKAAYDAAVASYRGTVLNAFANVENDLSGLRILAQQADALDSAVRDATEGSKIAFNEYQAGTVDYTTVATALATQLSDQQTALNVQEQRLLDAASLFGDLGGGWSAGQLCDPRHAQCAGTPKQASEQAAK
ncbi:MULTISPECIES: efflux transporter outer membrane subunit [Paraburkholderia]|nr:MULTISPECIES: efflux transporter outer membrane subunit [Paraburkholderia]MCX4161746.1 efflux transporter outer membrane subunit [Paraburkholderia megapolitana]MDN7157243.1 efflux transporter outer membrane subunit [Paraburkholderia sp. CHISQ3]MDQ6494288.1 efflux transporter outer membrane subunit [Paraburkholderia megapolitana]QDQ81757.1 efflux transporter outer membrane subunit [Paraburkholderia megapolitana]